MFIAIRGATAGMKRVEVWMVDNAEHPCYLPEYGHTDESDLLNLSFLNVVRRKTFQVKSTDSPDFFFMSLLVVCCS